MVIAENGEAGISAAEKEKPDLIISDVLMPKMSGVEMAQKINLLFKGLLQEINRLNN